MNDQANPNTQTTRPDAAPQQEKAAPGGHTPSEKGTPRIDQGHNEPAATPGRTNDEDMARDDKSTDRSAQAPGKDA